MHQFLSPILKLKGPESDSKTSLIQILWHLGGRRIFSATNPIGEISNQPQRQGFLIVSATNTCSSDLLLALQDDREIAIVETFSIDFTFAIDEAPASLTLNRSLSVARKAIRAKDP